MLSEYLKGNLIFEERGKRIEITPGEGESAQAYDLDVMGEGYFAALYQGMDRQPRSADGLYIGRLANGKTCVLIIELKGASGDRARAATQLATTMRHFIPGHQEVTLSDDGTRHHHEAASNESYLKLGPQHLVIGIVVGAERGRNTVLPNIDIGKYAGNLIRGYAIRLNSRAPWSYTLHSLCEEVSRNIGVSVINL
ncbi:MAG: hypothetical protein U9Q70_12805 [Chloroflexota bacterium]|nr:hypothetical protein [Chloroflexota bacterium]